MHFFRVKNGMIAVARAEGAFRGRINSSSLIGSRGGCTVDMPVEDIWKEGRYRRLVGARSLLCIWAVRELGISMTSLARKLNISTMAVSKSVARGAEIAKKEAYKLS